MIKLIQRGKYILFGGEGQFFIILDDKQVYAWTDGIISLVPRNYQKATVSSRKGAYRIYKVKDESRFANAVHLELFIGEGKWVGYLLPEGFPIKDDAGRTIMPAERMITKTTH